MRFYLVIIALLASLQLFAQEGEERQLLVVYGQQNGPSSDIIDRMLVLINPDIEQEDYSYVVKFKERPTYNVRENDVQAFLHLENFHIEGLQKHLNFSFEQEFQPTAINLQISIFKDKTIERSLTIKDIALKDGKIKPIELLLETGQSVKVTAIDALVSLGNLFMVKEKMSKVDSYVLSFYKLEEIASGLEDLNKLLGDPRDIIMAQDKLRIIEADFKRISILSFWNKLDYKSSEAKTGFNIDGMMNDVRDYLIQNARYVQFNAENQHLGYQQLGMEFYQKGKLDKARKNFETAIEKSPNFPQPHYMLALLSYQDKDYEKAITELQFLLDPRYVDHEETIEKSKELAQLIFDNLLKNAKKTFEKKGKEKALPLFLQTESFCINTIGVLCDLSALEEWIEKCK